MTCETKGYEMSVSQQAWSTDHICFVLFWCCGTPELNMIEMSLNAMRDAFQTQHVAFKTSTWETFNCQKASSEAVAEIWLMTNISAVSPQLKSEQSQNFSVDKTLWLIGLNEITCMKSQLAFKGAKHTNESEREQHTIITLIHS